MMKRTIQALMQNEKKYDCMQKNAWQAAQKFNATINTIKLITLYEISS